MKNNILNTISSMIVSNNGIVDWDITLDNIKSQLVKEIEESQKSDSLIEKELNELFDMVPAGTGVPSPAVVQAVSSNLAGGNFAKQLEFVPMVESFLGRTNRFVSKRGRSGGLFRIG